MTDNKYWIFLEDLRESGIVNMYGAAPYIKEHFGVTLPEARVILLDWMQNYDPEDYVE